MVMALRLGKCRASSFEFRSSKERGFESHPVHHYFYFLDLARTEAWTSSTFATCWVEDWRREGSPVEASCEGFPSALATAPLLYSNIRATTRPIVL